LYGGKKNDDIRLEEKVKEKDNKKSLKIKRKRRMKEWTKPALKEK